MRRFIAGAAVFAAAFVGSGSAAGAVDENAPHGGQGSHPHHVHTGDGECRDVDSVRFEPDDRGLHQGSNQSGPEQGPFHGTCATHVH